MKKYEFRGVILYRVPKPGIYFGLRIKEISTASRALINISEEFISLLQCKDVP